MSIIEYETCVKRSGGWVVRQFELPQDRLVGVALQRRRAVRRFATGRVETGLLWDGTPCPSQSWFPSSLRLRSTLGYGLVKTAGRQSNHEQDGGHLRDGHGVPSHEA